MGRILNSKPMANRCGCPCLKHYRPPNSIPMESLVVTARDGRLIHAGAGGCTWGRVFFAMSPQDEVEFDEANRRHRVEREKE